MYIHKLGNWPPWHQWENSISVTFTLCTLQNLLNRDWLRYSTVVLAWLTFHLSQGSTMCNAVCQFHLNWHSKRKRNQWNKMQCYVKLIVCRLICFPLHHQRSFISILWVYPSPLCSKTCLYSKMAGRNKIYYK